MKLRILLTLFVAISLQTFAQQKSFYDFSARTINGETFDFSTLKGKKVLIVNTASECSLAGQLEKLQELYEEYGGEDFEVVAFPSNDFGNREPGTNEEILQRCREKTDFSFTMMEKTSVKGEDAHPVFKWLTNSEENGTLDANVTWNFQKFLVDNNGNLVDVVWPIGSPTGNRIVEWLQEDL